MGFYTRSEIENNHSCGEDTRSGKSYCSDKLLDALEVTNTGSALATPDLRSEGEMAIWRTNWNNGGFGGVASGEATVADGWSGGELEEW